MAENIKEAKEKDFDEMLELWEKTVIKTHTFVSEDYIKEMKKDIREKYFYLVNLFLIKENNKIIAFLGISGDKIEMLFVEHNNLGKGLGSQLTEFAISKKGVKKVDVNEENINAYKFYLKKGFVVDSREEFDSSGKPHPILHMKLK